MAGDKLVNVKADTIDEFMENAPKAIPDGDGEIGKCSYEIKPKSSLKDDKIKTIKFSLDTSIVRAHWSGGKADARHKKAIQAAEALNAAHEAKHRKIAQDISQKMFRKAERDLIGKTQEDLDKAIEEITKAIDKAFGDLDRKEGAVDFVDDESKKEITVKLTGA